MRTLFTAILMLLVTPALAQPVCDADIAEPIGVLDGADQAEFVSRAAAMDPSADWDGSGTIDFFDVLAFLRDFDACDDSPQVIVIRDSIGPDSSTTHGSQVFGATTTLSGIDSWLGVEVSATPGSVLKEVSFVVAPASGFPDLDWNNQNFRLRIWNNSAEAISSPTVPSVRQIELVGPSSEPPFFGQVFHPFFTLVPSYLLTFDVSSEDVQFPSSGNLFIGITMVEGGAPERPAGIPETTEAGSTDIGWNSPQGVVYVSNSTLSQYDGRIAVRVSVID